MKMDKALEMILSLGILVGAGYLFVTKILPSLSPKGGGGSGNGNAATNTTACSDGSCDSNAWEQALGNAGATVSQAEKEGLSAAGTGGALLNSTRQQSQQERLLDFLFYRQVGQTTTYYAPSQVSGGGGGLHPSAMMK